ncbi:glycyl-radical enzyme activating protein [Hippea maritima]|uniref:Glycyl-radical enzyme activating protein family n=1 Tax=Hippea maritima (strain ATCC 700847 / DSM 10411 / MH2) TaxID=760142 RepID=F2LTL5_HIPMA|nr:glycyl-radical enzyme activating protein [Hippea maritima]AEA33340.1 glycyl-radical enzyme activating protein family [Hippea maritima DSM 10411]
MKGLIFDIKRYSIHDGPGVRTTVFFKGCPLRCLWCHNPESQKPYQQIIYYEQKCIRCLTCKAVCKEDAISFTNNKIEINTKRCTMCGKCWQSCPTNALEVVGQYYKTDELIEELTKDSAFFEGGGITISGGEAFVQYEFLMELIKGLKAKHLHLALDTTGYTDKEKLLSTVEFIDLYLYDLKVMDPAKHKQYTGVDNTIILKNLKALDEKGAQIAIRIPIIPTINDDQENIKATIEFLKQLNNVVSVDLLPYHSMMVDKYKRLKMPFLLGDIKKPSDEEMEELKETFQKEGFKVNIGG